jgi:hypothetical protein
MQSIGDYEAHLKRQKRQRQRAQRRTYAGTHRRLDPAQQAQYVAESILLHEAEGHGWTWAQYGLVGQWEMQSLVTEAIERLR